MWQMLNLKKSKTTTKKTHKQALVALGSNSTQRSTIYLDLIIMAKRDYYEILGVDRSVDDAALKKAYRRLAMKYHPDRNPDSAQAEASFKEAKEAYDVLSDGSKRSAYDLSLIHI